MKITNILTVKEDQEGNEVTFTCDQIALRFDHKNTTYDMMIDEIELVNTYVRDFGDHGLMDDIQSQIIYNYDVTIFKGEDEVKLDVSYPDIESVLYGLNDLKKGKEVKIRIS
jgi:hypothetical protein